jgi:hypothetical protein
LKDTLYVVGDPLANLNRIRINTFARFFAFLVLTRRVPQLMSQRGLDQGARAGELEDQAQDHAQGPRQALPKG